jgi:sarcosine oxidase, subunit gamma
VTGPTLSLCERRERLGLKGPRAAEWLTAQGVVLPTRPNTWTHSADASTDASAPDALLVARLGTAEFFLEHAAGSSTLTQAAQALERQPAGVYPVLREDWAFDLGGEAVYEVLAQVCNVNFSALPLDSNPVIMTLMIGVAVLVVPVQDGAAAQRRYRIWCDPTFGPYLGESLGGVVIECGGSYRGESA